MENKSGSNTPLISIVMPIYNGIEYLPETVASIKTQTYKNFEVISIDDHSTDGSLEYMQDVATADSRFFVKRRETMGGTAAEAIEYSLPYCRGEYYYYTSQDDLHDNDFLEKCIKKAIDTGADIVQPNMIFYYGEGENNKSGSEYPLNNDYAQVLDGRTAFCLTLDWRMHDHSLKKMDLVRKAGFKAEYLRSCEFYSRMCYLLANKIVFCNTNYYYRQNNPNADTKKVHYNAVDCLATDILLYETLVENNYSKQELKNRLTGICRLFAYYKNYYHKNKFDDKEKQLYIACSFKQAKKKLLGFIKSERHYVCLIPIYCHILFPVVQQFPALRKIVKCFFKTVH